MKPYWTTGHWGKQMYCMLQHKIYAREIHVGIQVAADFGWLPELTCRFCIFFHVENSGHNYVLARFV